MPTDSGVQQFAVPRAFVQTYNPTSHEDPWELVKEYRTVLEAAAVRPKRLGKCDFPEPRTPTASHPYKDGG